MNPRPDSTYTRAPTGAALRPSRENWSLALDALIIGEHAVCNRETEWRLLNANALEVVFPALWSSAWPIWIRHDPQQRKSGVDLRCHAFRAIRKLWTHFTVFCAVDDAKGLQYGLSAKVRP